MSYCRFSTHNFKCDLYVYQHCGGYYSIHVAANKAWWHVPEFMYSRLSMFLILRGWKKLNAVLWKLARPYDIAARWINAWSPRHYYKSEHAGKTYKTASAEEAVRILHKLRDAGFWFPDQVIEAIREDGDMESEDSK